jgi:hypothetical protein
MQRAYNIVRKYVLPVLAAAFVLPIVGEFSVEVAREHGFFERPTERMEAIFSFLFAIREHPLIWPALMFVTGLLIGTWLDSFVFRRIRGQGVPPAPFLDRDEFVNEVIFLPDLIKESPLLTGKKFTKCLLRGPIFLKLQNANTLIVLLDCGEKERCLSHAARRIAYYWLCDSRSACRERGHQTTRP